MTASASNDRSTMWTQPIDVGPPSRGRRLLAGFKRGWNYLISYYAEHVIGSHVPIGAWEGLDQEPEVIESIGELDRVVHELPPEWVNDRLRDALGSGKVLVLLRDLPRASGRGRLIGAAVCEPAGTLDILGRRMKLSPDWLLTHVVIVHPDYRGQRKAFELTKLRIRYGHGRGISLFCGTINNANVASIRAHSRIHFQKRIVTIRQIALFGGKVKWTTPLSRLRDAMEQMARNAKKAEAAASETTNRPDRSRS